MLLKRDFIRFVLFTTPRFSSEEVVKKLKADIDVSGIYERIKVLISTVMEKYLTLDMVTNEDGTIVNNLPEQIYSALVGNPEHEISEFIDRECDKTHILSRIIAHIERLIWTQGLPDMILKRYCLPLEIDLFQLLFRLRKMNNYA